MNLESIHNITQQPFFIIFANGKWENGVLRYVYLIILVESMQLVWILVLNRSGI